MRVFLRCALYLFPLLILSVTGAEVAVIHSDTPSFDWNETDILGNEVSLTKYTIGNLNKMVAELDRYDLVIVGSGSNYDANRDFSEFHDEWSRFLSRGGVLLMLDTNYTQQTERIIGKLAPGNLNPSWECGGAEDVGEVTPQPVAEMLFRYPYSGEEEFPLCLRAAHYVNPSPKWRVLACCAHNNPVILDYPYGKGRIVATPLFALGSANGKRFLRSLVQNLLFEQKCRNVGLELTRFSANFDSSPGEWKLAMKNRSGETMRVKGRVVFGRISAPMQEINADIAPDAEFELSTSLTEKTNFAAGVVLTSPILSFTGHFAPPDLTPSWHLPDRIFAARTNNFRISLKRKVPEEFAGAELLVDGSAFPLKLETPDAKTVTGDLSSLAAGKYKMQLVLRRPDGSELRLPERTASITQREMKLDIDARGNFLLHNKPFFPIGWYHISDAEGVSAASRMECLEFSKKYGYNMIFAGTIGDPADDEFMMAAEKYGISIICGPRSFELIAEKRDKWNAVVIWTYDLDEPEHWGKTPDEVRDLALKIVSQVPDCPTFSSMETALTVKRYAGVCDIVGTHGYPVPSYPLRLVSDKLRLLVDLSEQYMFVPMGTVQCFGYPNYPPAGYPGMPTAQQVRNMVYQAIASNVKGILFYTFADGEFDLQQESALYNLMKTIPSEIKMCVPFLLHGEYSRLGGGNADIVGARWLLNGEVLQMWINTAKDSRILANPEYQKGMKPMFGSKTGASGTSITMQPEEVIVWQK